MTMAGCTYDIVVDTDLDGTPDDEDACPTDGGLQKDTGVCGCNLRLINGKCVATELKDDDADGVPNDNDLCPNDAIKVMPGICGCATPDTDSDNDTIPDCEDKCPKDPNKNSPGYCGCGTVDIDSDEDGIPDCKDECPDNKNLVKKGPCGCDDTDKDMDKTPACVDECDEDPLKVISGICGCGVSDEQDADEDNVPDCIDKCPLDPQKMLPGVCGCHVPDNDSDMDGVMDCEDACPNDPLKSENPGACGCNVPDVDDNKNGTYDCHETCVSSTVGKTEFGYCGCAVEDIDSDGDTLPDCLDRCPNDPAKVAPQICGCNHEELDTDLDGVLDCVDACPMDRAKSENEGICGCNPELEYNEAFDDTFDSDHDGVPDCIDACPFDGTRQERHACECSSAGLDQFIDDDWVCVEKGGVLQADYAIYLAYALLPEDSHRALSDAYKARKIAAPVVRLAYLPAGNLLSNPGMEYDTEGWTEDGSHAVLYGTGRYAEIAFSRPFARFPLYWGHLYGTTLSQSITLPTFESDQVLTAGMFAFSQTFGGQSADPINVTISSPSGNKSLSNQKSDTTTFRFHSVQTTLSPTASNTKVTFRYYFGDSSNWAGHYGAQVQYMAAWLGDREIRFSNDGENWTEWQKFEPSADGTSEVWHRDDWNLVEGYGGNDEPGRKTVYMQTHDLLTDKYYYTSDTFEFVKPKEDGRIFIGESPIASQSYTSKEEVINACKARTIAENGVNIYFIPGGNLLQNAAFLDNANASTSAEPWTMKDATVLWRAEAEDEPSRHIPNTAVISLNASESSLSQDIDVPGSVPLMYNGILFSSTTSAEAPEVSITSYKDGEIMKQASMKLSTESGTHLTRLEVTGTDIDPMPEGIDKIHVEIKAAETDAESTGITRINSPYFTFGRNIVRFSFDDKKTWTRWLNANTKNWYQHPNDAGIMNDITNNLMYPNAQLVSKDHKATVYMQTYNLDTSTYYETSETVDTAF